MIKLNEYETVEDLDKAIESFEKTAKNYPEKSLIHKIYMIKAVELKSFKSKRQAEKLT